MELLENKTDVIVSIIIPTFNRKRELNNCMKSLVLQKGLPHFEVIIVDDGSDDGTCDSIYCNYKDFPFPLRVIQQKRGGPASARNTGAIHAKGSTLLFIDSDCCATTNWVRLLAEKINSDYEIVGGPSITPPKANIFSLAVNYITHTWIGGWGNKWHAFGLIPGFRLRGMNFGIKREIFLSQNGFKPLWYGEDTEFSERLRANGFTIKRCDEAIVIHCESRSVYDYMLEAFAKGWTISKLLNYSLVPFRLLYIMPFLLIISIILYFALVFVGMIEHMQYYIDAILLNYCVVLIFYGIKGWYIHKTIRLMIAVPIAGFLLHLCYAIGISCGLFLRGVPTKNALRPSEAIDLKSELCHIKT